MSYQIITFYEFKDLKKIGDLEEIKNSLKWAMRENSIFGTIILAEEGFNSTICGESGNVERPSGRDKIEPHRPLRIPTTDALKTDDDEQEE